MNALIISYFLQIQDKSISNFSEVQYHIVHSTRPLEPYPNVAIDSNFRGKTEKMDSSRSSPCLTKPAPSVRSSLAAIYIQWCEMDYPMCSMEISVWPSLHNRYCPETWSRGKLGLGLFRKISFLLSFYVVYLGYIYDPIMFRGEILVEKYVR